MVIDEGQKFTLRSGSDTIAAGVVVKVEQVMSPQEKKTFLRGKTRREREKLFLKYQDVMVKYQVPQN